MVDEETARVGGGEAKAHAKSGAADAVHVGTLERSGNALVEPVDDSPAERRSVS